MKNPVIVCALCRKPVDRVEWRDDFATRLRVITAFCHGDSDTMRLSDADLFAMRGNEPGQGVAFSGARINGAPHDQ